MYAVVLSNDGLGYGGEIDWAETEGNRYVYILATSDTPTIQD